MNARAFAFATSLAARVLAQPPPCSPVVSGDRELAAQIGEAIEAREHVDRCASVAVTRSASGIVIVVVLADGRSTRRIVERDVDVVPAVEALLLVPQPPAPAASTAEETQPLEPITPVLQRGVVERPPTTLTAARTSGVRAELSVFSGGRVGDAQTSLGAGAFAFLDVGHWLVGVGGRVDDFQGMNVAPDAVAISVSALLGRRFGERSIALDLYAGPALSIATNEPSAYFAPRVLAGARVTFGARSLLRAFVGVDADFGSSAGGSATSPRLSPWSAGLLVGATVGMP